MKSYPFKIFLFLFSLTSLFSTCNKEAEETFEEQQETYNFEENMSDIEKAVAVLQPTEGNKVKGTITFLEDGGEVSITGFIEGLTPGLHGFHVHEYGDCSASDASSAGDHFAPINNHHGEMGADSSHAGDLGNIEADENGKAEIDIKSAKLSFYGESSIIGRALVVHSGKDDLTTQPSGNSGSRVACAVIGAVSKSKNN